eukprot:11118594-Alexandrium_andersonii.AAC.1
MGSPRVPVCVRGVVHRVPVVEVHKHLGSMRCRSGALMPEIKHRVRSTMAPFVAMKKSAFASKAF